MTGRDAPFIPSSRAILAICVHRTLSRRLKSGSNGSTEADNARQKKRTREVDEDSSDDSWAIPERPSPYVSKRARIRQANYAFQDDWGLGDTSSILPLPLEHELEQAAQTDNARPRTASPKERTDAPDDAPLLRFGRGHRLIRQPARSLPQMIISTRRS